MKRMFFSDLWTNITIASFAFLSSHVHNQEPTFRAWLSNLHLVEQVWANLPNLSDGHTDRLHHKKGLAREIIRITPVRSGRSKFYHHVNVKSILEFSGVDGAI